MIDKTPDSPSPEATEVQAEHSLFLRVVSWLVPALRHEIRGSLNSTSLNLEVAKRALDKGDLGKSRAALERAADENRRLATELPTMVSWLAPDGGLDTMTSGELGVEIEKLIGPALSRSNIRLARIDIEDSCLDLPLSARQCQRVLLALGGLALAVGPTDTSAQERELHLVMNREGRAVRFSMTPSPSVAAEGISRLSQEPCFLRSTGTAFYLDLEID